MLIFQNYSKAAIVETEEDMDISNEGNSDAHISALTKYFHAPNNTCLLFTVIFFLIGAEILKKLADFGVAFW